MCLKPRAMVKGKGELAEGSADSFGFKSRGVKEMKSPNSSHPIHSFSHLSPFFPFWSGAVYLELTTDSEEVSKIVQRYMKLHLADLHIKR